MKSNQKYSPVKSRLSGLSYPIPFNQHAMARRAFLCLVVLFLTSCSTLHKLVHKERSKENTNTVTTDQVTNYSQSVTTEKLDTIIHTKADTAHLAVFVPAKFDSTSHDDSVESNGVKINVHREPIIKDGKVTGTKVTVTATRKSDSVTVKIDKKTVTNSQTFDNKKTETHTKKSENSKDKNVQRSGLGIAGIVTIVVVVALILIFLIFYIKSKS